ncbi:MAG TPA: hypothetical protein VIK54_12635 [Acidimicrobiia bacterium]
MDEDRESAPLRYRCRECDAELEPGQAVVRVLALDEPHDLIVEITYTCCSVDGDTAFLWRYDADAMRALTGSELPATILLACDEVSMLAWSAGLTGVETIADL